MHEMSLCESIIGIAEEQASVQHFSKVKSIRLEIGKLSCVQADAMAFAFDAVAKNTILDGARLEIDEVPGKGWCAGCSTEVEINQRYDGCPLCEYYPIEIRQGDAMRIKDMEVE
ncbi:MAG: hydrogenase maturation nickel metallochaperone HypA [Zetaproteobacteria bacterium CG1_02_53_45]|nr:MAG: hydrogenase maturation nickel metallochaperone HypA [Zetaproteobacteria bacterium CG1_02_53_45]